MLPSTFANPRLVRTSLRSAKFLEPHRSDCWFKRLHESWIMLVNGTVELDFLTWCDVDSRWGSPVHGSKVTSMGRVKGHLLPTSGFPWSTFLLEGSIVGRSLVCICSFERYEKVSNVSTKSFKGKYGHCRASGLLTHILWWHLAL